MTGEDGSTIPYFREDQIVTVFRSRLRAGVDAEYQELSDEVLAIARQARGFVDFKTFVAEDGERVSLVTFTTPDTHRAWREDPRHVAAQLRGRDEFFSEFSIQVGDCLHVRHWTQP